MKQFLKEKILPLSLTAFIILADQITKAIIVIKWPLEPGTHYRFITQVFGSDFMQIIHVRNPAIAFSLGKNLPAQIQPVVFIVIPILVLGFLLWYYLRSNEFTAIQRWAAAGIIGGGLGNIIDRIFRSGSGGVVDFLDVAFFKFVFESGRWPTFNIADATVVVCCFLLFITMFISPKKNKMEQVQVKEQIDE